MTSWVLVVTATVAVAGLVLGWVKLRMNADKWHRENAPTFTVAAYWMNRTAPHVTVEHRGPTLARVELEVLEARAGKWRAGLSKETSQGRAVDTYELPGPIQQGHQVAIRVELDTVSRGQETVLRVTSRPQRDSQWPRWFRLGGSDWEDTYVVVFPVPSSISTADTSSRIPTQAEVRQRQE